MGLRTLLYQIFLVSITVLKQLCVNRLEVGFNSGTDISWTTTVSSSMTVSTLTCSSR